MATYALLVSRTRCTVEVGTGCRHFRAYTKLADTEWIYYNNTTSLEYVNLNTDTSQCHDKNHYRPPMDTPGRLANTGLALSITALTAVVSSSKEGNWHSQIAVDPNSWSRELLT